MAGQTATVANHACIYLFGESPGCACSDEVTNSEPHKIYLPLVLR
jgi:hypothetical protein